MAYIVQHPLSLRQKQRRIDRWTAIEWQLVQMVPEIIAPCMVSFWPISSLAYIVLTFRLGKRLQFVCLLDSNKRSCKVRANHQSDTPI